MALDKFRIDGKTALVTGGSRGIGLAIVTIFVEAGANVVITGRTCTDAVKDLLEEHRDRVAWSAGDVRDRETPGRLVSATLERFGQLDILVNNAGVADNGNFHEFDDERLNFILETNLVAPFRIAREAIKPMLRQAGGAILNIGSISADVANKPQLQVAYNSSKAAIHQMTKVMAFEYAGRNIRVNALAPGYVISDMTEGGIANPQWNSVWTENTPMGRFAEPEEMATCALFLCSDAASYVTGAVLTADGGYTTH
ncbi:SDR family NAD(P)-dependent oxidoreductase [Mesorhizobium silamurunense]|uniref:SDR family NAD(P)-dependent oxidoreductase n=1 Tax=Mesorhizobium silamurunense TaxID=499528 RepID=UPI001782F9C0|nr:glucose 1-dehydrogenase [Mesorhizobium silamurunense]